MVAEPGPFVLVPLVGFHDLGDAPDRRVGGKSEPLAKLSIAELLKDELVGEPALESNARQPGRGLVEALDRCLQLGGGFRVRQELGLERELHGPIVLVFPSNINGGGDSPVA